MEKAKSKRGFASMSPEKQREIASRGGRSAHQRGTAYEWNTTSARTAGRKGGQVSRGGRGKLTPHKVVPGKGGMRCTECGELVSHAIHHM